MQRNVTIASATARTASLRTPGLALLVLATLCAVGKAQRFDQFQLIPTTTVYPLAHVVTDPQTGSATVVAISAGLIDTFAWNGTSFVPSGAPSPNGAAGDAMGATAGGLVYFDSLGRTSTRPSGGAWSTLTALTPSPSARGLAAMTNRVTSNGSAFLFGGGAGTTLTNDLWEFNGTSWINRTPTSGPLPVARQGATLVSDGLGSLYMFGGTAANNSVLNDVWRFRSGLWQLINKAPIKRTYHAMMPDTVRNNFLVMGGTDSNGTVATDAWTMSVTSDGSVQWTQVATGIALNAPTGITWGAMDATRQEPLMIDLNSDVTRDALASSLVFASSVAAPTCRVPNLQIVNQPTQPRINSTVGLGGIVGVAGAPMFLQGAFVNPQPGIAIAPTPIPGSTCLSFLPSASQTIGSTVSTGAGSYAVPFVIPNNPVFIGSVVDFQAFGANGAQIIASQALRIGIGR